VLTCSTVPSPLAGDASRVVSANELLSSLLSCLASSDRERGWVRASPALGVTKSDDAEALDAEALDAEALDADVGRFETEERGGMVSLEKRAERKTSRCSENSGVHDHALFIHREHSSRVTRNEFDRLSSSR